MRFRPLLLCLILSGFAGLSYQLLWVRLLSVSFGSTTASFATVLAVFFGGLALGSWLAARYLGWFSRPGMAYGVIEGIMGLAGILLYPVLANLGSAFAAVDPGPGMLGGILRALFSAPLLLVPTVLMGMTLPLLCKAMIVDDASIGKGTGLIYGYNTLGACLGAFLVTYELLPRLGVFKTTLVTVAVNIIVTVVTLLVVKNEKNRAAATAGSSEPAPSRSSKAWGEQRKYVILAFVITFLSGFSFIAVEIVWSRLFSTILSGTIYGIGSVLIAILLGIALGSWIAALMARSGFKPLPSLTFSLVIFALGVIAILRGIEPIAYFIKFIGETSTNPGYQIYHELAAVLLVLFVPSAAIGTSLPLLVQVVENTASGTGKTLGKLYAVNTAGSISGSLITGFYLLPVLGSETTSYLVMLLLAVATILACFASWVNGHKIVAIPAVLGCVVILSFDGYNRQAVTLFASGSNGASFQQMNQFIKAQTKGTVYFSEGENATVSIARDNYSLGMSLNGLGQGSRSFLHPEFNLESTLVGYVGMPFLKETERAFVVGLGAGNTVHIIRDLGMRYTKVVELEPKVVEAVEEIFKDVGGFGPQVEIEINDARHSLLTHRAQGGEPYDLIASMPAHPWVANAIFTKEFFELAKSNLKPDGVFVSWFGLWSGGIKMDQTVTDSVTNAFASVFSNFAILYVDETSSIFLVGSPSPLRFDLERAQELAKHPRIVAHSVLKDPLFLPLRSNAWRSADRPLTGLSPLNSDDSAYAEVWAPFPVKTIFRRTSPELIDAKPWPSKEALPESDALFSAALKRFFDLAAAPLTKPMEKDWEQRASSLLAEANDHVPEQTLCLAKAKKEIFMLRLSEAKAILSACPTSPEVVAGLALATYMADGNASSLTGVPYSKELALLLLDKEYRALPALSVAPELPESDPVAWAYVRLASNEVLNAGDKVRLQETLASEFLKIRRHGLLRAVAEISRRNDMSGLYQVFMNAAMAQGMAEAQDVFNLALADWKANNRVQAVQKMERVTELNPQHQLSHLYLLKAYREASRLEDEIRIRLRLRSIGVNRESIDAVIALEEKSGTEAFQEKFQ